MNRTSMNRKSRRPQQGVFLLEALIAILIFSLGILGMVAMGGVAIAAQSDAQYRTDAANYASEMAAQMALAMNNSTSQNSAAFASFAHQPITGGPCNFAGSVSGNPIVAAWVDRINGNPDPRRGLPGATPGSQQIMVNATPGAYSRVEITICWQPPATAALSGAPMNQYQLVTYIAANESAP